MPLRCSRKPSAGVRHVPAILGITHLWLSAHLPLLAASVAQAMAAVEKRSPAHLPGGASGPQCQVGTKIEALLPPCLGQRGSTLSEQCWSGATIVEVGGSASKNDIGLKQSLGLGAAWVRWDGHEDTAYGLIGLEWARNAATKLPCDPNEERSQRPIPRLVHQSAPTNPANWHARWAKLHEGWKHLCPDELNYKVILWNDEDLRNLVSRLTPEYMDVFDGYKLNILRADFSRGLILLAFGGVYVDMDTEGLRCPFGHLPAGRASAVGMPPVPWPEAKRLNSFMSSPAGALVWRDYLEEAAHRFRDTKKAKPVYELTGPGVLDAVADSLVQKGLEPLFVLSPDHFNPLRGTGAFEAVDQLIVRHYITNTWMDDEILTRDHVHKDTQLLNVAQLGQLDVAEQLLQKRACLTCSGSYSLNPLQAAAYTGHADMVKLLAHWKADVTQVQSGTAPIHLAARRGHISTVGELLKLRADVNARDGQGATPVFWASELANEHLASFLIEHGADLQARNSNGETPIDYAIKFQHPSMAETLAKWHSHSGVSLLEIRKQTRQSLHKLAYEGDVGQLWNMIEEGADFSQADDGGRTPLHWAALGGHTETVLYLDRLERRAV